MSPDRSGVGEEADSGMTGDAATAAGALEVHDGDTKTCPAHQHVVGAKPAASCWVEGQVPSGGRQALHPRGADGSGSGGVASVPVLRPSLMAAEICGTAVCFFFQAEDGIRVA